MRKSVLTLVCALLLLSLPAPARADDYSEHNYMQEMIDAAVSGEDETGRALDDVRDRKIDALVLDETKINYDDLLLLGKIIQAEAGSSWLPDDWKLAVGEVVLNRVASPEFPDTVKDVLEQPGQYYGANNSYFSSLRPDERHLFLAVRLLQGERVLSNPAAVFQSNEIQGSGVCRKFSDSKLGSTYFCLSSHPELYTG